MLSTYHPKSIQVLAFDRFDYDFLKTVRSVEEYTWHLIQERILVKDMLSNGV